MYTDTSFARGCIFRGLKECRQRRVILTARYHHGWRLGMRQGELLLTPVIAGTSVLAQAAMTNYCRLGSLNHRNVFLPVLEAWKMKIKVAVGFFSRRLFSYKRSPSHCVQTWDEERVSYLVPLLIGHESASWVLWWHHLTLIIPQRLHLQILSYWGLEIQHVMGGGTHILSIETSFLRYSALQRNFWKQTPTRLPGKI